MQFKIDGSIISPFFSIYSVFTTSACFNADWGRGGSLLEGTLHFSVSTTKLKGSILAGSAGSSLLKISLNSVHNVRIFSYRLLSPFMFKRDNTSTVESDVNQGAKVPPFS